jgi:hypothetical protein
MSIERARRIIAEWIAEHAAAGKGTPPPARPKPEPGAGREWLGTFASFVLLHGHEQQGVGLSLVLRHRGPVFQLPGHVAVPAHGGVTHP